MSEKTEKPTPKKLRDARKEGNVGKSAEVVTAALTVIVFGYFFLFGASMRDQFLAMLIFPAQLYAMPAGDAFVYAFEGVLSVSIALVTPLLILIVVVAIMANVLQFGVLFSSKAVQPKLERINPAKNLKNIFSMQKLMELLKSIVKISVLTIVIGLVLLHALEDLVLSAKCGFECTFSVFVGMLAKIIIFTVLAFILVAVVDVIFQKSNHIKQLKMTREEVQREYKEMEGDPLIKSKRKSLFQEILSHDASDRVRRSSVVVTNPVHVAVALRYKEDETPLPVIMAKGEDHVALMMRKVAEDENIPVMQNVSLARTLNRSTQVDDFIPPDLIEPVAEVLRAVRKVENS